MITTLTKKLFLTKVKVNMFLNCSLDELKIILLEDNQVKIVKDNSHPEAVNRYLTVEFNRGFVESNFYYEKIIDGLFIQLNVETNDHIVYDILNNHKYLIDSEKAIEV